MLLTNEILAKKYALAYLNTHPKGLSTQDLLSLIQLNDYLKGHKKILVYFNMISTTHITQQNFLEMLQQGFLLGPSFDRLLMLLIEHRRIALLNTVIKQIITCHQKMNAIHVFSISTSHALEDKDKEVITSFVHTLVNGVGSVEITFSIDKALISGIRVKSDTILWERSIQKLLRNIKHSLLQRVGS